MGDVGIIRSPDMYCRICASSSVAEMLGLFVSLLVAFSYLEHLAKPPIFRSFVLLCLMARDAGNSMPNHCIRVRKCAYRGF